MWNNDWRNELRDRDEACYMRLCDCRNRKADILTIATFMSRYNPNKSAKECLDMAIEWLTDWNDQIEIYPNKTEYETFLEKLLTNKNL